MFIIKQIFLRSLYTIISNSKDCRKLLLDLVIQHLLLYVQGGIQFHNLWIFCLVGVRSDLPIFYLSLSWLPSFSFIHAFHLGSTSLRISSNNDNILGFICPKIHITCYYFEGFSAAYRLVNWQLFCSEQLTIFQWSIVPVACVQKSVTTLTCTDNVLWQLGKFSSIH